jgi:geranylgeranyl reductase
MKLFLPQSAHYFSPNIRCRSNPAREAFVEMCADTYVQKMTFDSYLYKTVVPGNPLDDIKLAINTIGSLVRANALRQAGKALAA